MEKYIKVNFRDLETKEFLEGTTFYEISHSFQKYFKVQEALLCRVFFFLKNIV